MISCLMITRPGREREIERAVACFAAQSLDGGELVIVHDEDDGLSSWLGQLANRHAQCQIVIDPQPAGMSLGALRNRSLALASRAVICQWDDDDLNHPERLEVQYQRLQDADADFCFLTDEIHLFMEDHLAFWDDWTVEQSPGHLIQGTIMGYRDRMPAYPDIGRGEDTPLTREIVQRGCRVAEVAGKGWLHVYCFTGDNAWGIEHHKAISRWKRLDHARLSEEAGVLERELARYPVYLPGIRFPHERGVLALQIGRPG